jgi:hypothetical protein
MQTSTTLPGRELTCVDCYFRQNALCALVVDRPCPTFRPAKSLLVPPSQPQLVPRPLAAA